MSAIFLSYRRDDTRADAGRLYDRLIQRWGKGRVFMDIDNIRPGDDFIETIDKTLDACAVLVLLIGPSWVTTQNASGVRRLDDPDDFHRLEIERALKRQTRMIPVLVGNARMPSSAQLPDSLKALARRQASEISDLRFDADVLHLNEVIRDSLAGPNRASRPAPSARKRILVVLGAAQLLPIGASLWFYVTRDKTAPVVSQPPSPPVSITANNSVTRTGSTVAPAAIPSQPQAPSTPVPTQNSPAAPTSPVPAPRTDATIAAPKAPKTTPPPGVPTQKFPAARLSPDNKATLSRQIIDPLSQVAKIELVLVTGHVAGDTTQAEGQRRSESYANAVRDYLVSRGIPRDKIETLGMGKVQPVPGYARNEAANSRVEVEVKGEAADGKKRTLAAKVIFR